MNDEMLETIEDVESDQPVNHAWRKRRIVLLLLIYSAFLGIIMCFVPEESTSLDFLIGLPFLILGIAWCFIDASERDHRIGRLTKLALVLFFVVGLPIYLFQTRVLGAFKTFALILLLIAAMLTSMFVTAFASLYIGILTGLWQ